MMQIFKDKVVFITGTNRGIGKSLVKEVLNKGAIKVYATSRDLSKLPNFNDDRVIPLKLDITNDIEIEHCAEKAFDTQILINNAGVLSQGNVLEGSIDNMKYDMNINYYGTINMMRAFAPILEKNTPAKIINIVSIAAYSSLPFIAGYAASKAALFSATQSVRIELAKKGITVHAINPGAIDTDMNKGSDWDMTSPNDVAKSILNKVEMGVLDIIPDDMGLGMYNAWREDPENLAKIFHDMYYQI
ncbi:SDR family oxidoreductase [Flavivirga sp. 57AJ16]|uniref:SDR family oxidoreductase n=1 Tax=Flavivirga sp. 57AJ16 TaxID=3025307 RepID=UPI00236569AA|nr:SDR family oxidoreductase [Flavivirga sp. 57AJ16]MDD7886185.1 SDR family oxidoreductase [Flavivirga sp. 57AJ16]